MSGYERLVRAKPGTLWHDWFARFDTEFWTATQLGEGADVPVIVDRQLVLGYRIRVRSSELWPVAGMSYTWRVEAAASGASWWFGVEHTSTRQVMVQYNELTGGYYAWSYLDGGTFTATALFTPAGDWWRIDFDPVVVQVHVRSSDDGVAWTTHVSFDADADDFAAYYRPTMTSLSSTALVVDEFTIRPLVTAHVPLLDDDTGEQLLDDDTSEPLWAEFDIDPLPPELPGVPVGLGDWRFVMEVLLPTPGAGLWDVALWDEGLWGELEWHDITAWVRGTDWSRGSDEPYGRPRVGTGTVTLSCADGEWSPWTPNPPSGGPAYFGPGTVIRWGCVSETDVRAGGWLPQFCGIVDGWSPVYVAANLADRYVDVTAVETLRDLAGIDENALPGVVGGGEDPATRLRRLLDAAGWKYGFRVEAGNLIDAPGAYPLQSTDMAANRLAECYRTADSCDVDFRTDRTGQAVATNVEYLPAAGADLTLVQLSEFSWDGAKRRPIVIFHPTASGKSGDVQIVLYDPPSFRAVTADENVVNVARFARAGGSQQAYRQEVSVGRFGERALIRNDFINTTDPPVAQLAQYTTIRRGLNTLRVDALTVQVVDRGVDAGLAMLAADVRNYAFVYSPEHLEFDDPHIYGFIRSMTHRVTPRDGSSLTWEVTFGFDTREVRGLTGAQLPETL